MKLESVIGKEKEILTFMKRNGFPVFHKSNIFFRDIEYGIRSYFLDTLKEDIGTRKTGEFAGDLIKDLEKRGMLKPFSEGTWILNMPEFLNQKKVDEPKPAA
jgi:hypothetical protein